jgi:hypothetical protein
MQIHGRRDFFLPMNIGIDVRMICATGITYYDIMDSLESKDSSFNLELIFYG